MSEVNELRKKVEKLEKELESFKNFKFEPKEFKPKEFKPKFDFKIDPVDEQTFRYMEKEANLMHTMSGGGSDTHLKYLAKERARESYERTLKEYDSGFWRKRRF